MAPQPRDEQGSKLGASMEATRPTPALAVARRESGSSAEGRAGILHELLVPLTFLLVLVVRCRGFQTALEIYDHSQLTLVARTPRVRLR